MTSPTNRSNVFGQRKTMSVPEAGRVYFELGKNASYEAAKRGDIPVVKVGKLLRVPVALMEKKVNGAVE